MERAQSHTLHSIQSSITLNREYIMFDQNDDLFTEISEKEAATVNGGGWFKKLFSWLRKVDINVGGGTSHPF
jgi:hypothetical protein